jgi:hypothetical protein
MSLTPWRVGSRQESRPVLAAMLAVKMTAGLIEPPKPSLKPNNKRSGAGRTF